MPTRTLGSGGSQLPAPFFRWDMERAGKASVLTGVQVGCEQMCVVLSSGDREAFHLHQDMLGTLPLTLAALWI